MSGVEIKTKNRIATKMFGSKTAKQKKNITGENVNNEPFAVADIVIYIPTKTVLISLKVKALNIIKSQLGF